MVQESTNTFSDGLISDLNPLTTPNTVLTDALNATLLTFNGNELVLQNDMGNAKIDGCKLTNGFIPLEIKEHGGILYIISTDGTNTEIGSFPSPQYNSFILDTKSITTTSISGEDGKGGGLFKNYIISDIPLNSGDKFALVLKVNDTSYISGTAKKFYKPKLLSIYNGQETDITSLVTPYQSGFWFLNPADLSTPITESDFQIYKLRKSGKLAFRFELETIKNLYLKDRNNNNFPDLNVSDKTLKFTVYSDETENLVKIDTIRITGKIIDLITGESVNLINTSYLDNKRPFPISVNSTEMIFSLDSTEKLVNYKIEGLNSIYDLEFPKFIIENTIDLTKDPLYWDITPYYELEDYYINVDDYGVKIIVAKYATINGVRKKLKRDNSEALLPGEQDAFVLFGYDNRDFVTDNYDIGSGATLQTFTKTVDNYSNIFKIGETNVTSLINGEPFNLYVNLYNPSVSFDPLYKNRLTAQALPVASSFVLNIMYNLNTYFEDINRNSSGYSDTILSVSVKGVNNPIDSVSAELLQGNEIASAATGNITVGIPINDINDLSDVEFITYIDYDFNTGSPISRGGGIEIKIISITANSSPYTLPIVCDNTYNEYSTAEGLVKELSCTLI